MRRFSWLPLLLIVIAPACDGTITGTDGFVIGDVGDDEALEGVEENDGIILSTTMKAGDRARVCNTGGSGLRQRSGPGTGYSILRTMPEGTTVSILAQSGSWYRNDWGGRIGWSSGQYLCKVESSGGGTTSGGFSAPASRAGAIQIAKAAVGYSYWWGGAAFANGGARGACYGSCPNCSHSGQYGADCSGHVAKVWQLTAAMPMGANKHPYSTYNFYNEQTHWTRLARGSIKTGDALVYRKNNAGHIVIYEKGDPWGSLWAYEARGCSYGIVHNLRSFGSDYRAIQRKGF
jgi:hypothetical protein